MEKNNRIVKIQQNGRLSAFGFDVACALQEASPKTSEERVAVVKKFVGFHEKNIPADKLKVLEQKILSVADQNLSVADFISLVHGRDVKMPNSRDILVARSNEIQNSMV